MFYHGYDSYMLHAFPDAELRPLSCEGGPFELVKIPLVTLIDTLDTLVILGNHSEFRRAVHLVSSHYPSFDLDVNVSVFETTIRVLGGLLSAHLMAVDPLLQIYDNTNSGAAASYDGWLLTLATDLGNRLLPAFRTNTGIPYGTVNLRHGVPRGETEIASTAGAGSLIVEFEALSCLTKDRRFGDAAYGATQALFDRRSPIGLLGKHIHTKTGRWFESMSGIGSNSDSFYEYLLKAFLLYRRQKYFRMFTDTFSAIKRFVQVGDWFNDVDMFNGKLRRNRVENLAAFWPGMEATLGFSDDSSRQLNSLYAVWTDLGFLPEEFDNVQWQQGTRQTAAQYMNPIYPLRPELIESTYHQYRTTKDRSWLAAGVVFLESLENHTRTACGYGSITMNVGVGGGGVGGVLTDAMPSFFLAETCKYLYLLFDEDNFVHERAYIFSTEAHLFDPLQLEGGREEEGEEDEEVGGGGGEEEEADSAEGSEVIVAEADDQDVDASAAAAGAAVGGVEEQQPLLPSQCLKQQWWDAPNSYDAFFIQVVGGSTAPPQALPPRSPVRKIRELLQTTSLGGGGTGGDEIKWKSNLLKEWASKSRALSFANQILPLLGLGGGSSSEAAADDDGDFYNDDADADEEDGEDGGEGEDDDEEEIRALHALQQRDVVSVLAMTATQAMRLEHRRDLYELHASLHGHPAYPPDFGVVGGLAGGARRKRPNACYPEDESDHVDGHGLQAPVRSGDGDGDGLEVSPDVKPVQTVEVSMGALGDFQVQVYQDGFVVHSKAWGDTLEISNVGQPTMFLRDQAAEGGVGKGSGSGSGSGAKTVMGSMDGRVVSCTVGIVDEGEGEGEGEREGGEVWERACSVAAFGPVSLASPLVLTLDFEPQPADGESGGGGDYLAKLGNFCPLADPAAAAATTAASSSASSPPSPSPPQPKPWWGAALAAALLGRRVASSPPLRKLPLHGRIAIARRGTCMFEDKTSVAEAKGAAALIVVNDKDMLFLMSQSGKKPANAARTIPTVMLTKSDGNALLAEVQRRRCRLPVKIKITLTSLPMALDVPILGANEFPKLRMRKNIIYAVGRGIWGAVLTSTTGLDWQLFIMGKNDMDINFTPGSINKQTQTWWASFSTNPAESYAMQLGEKCPKEVSVEDTGRLEEGGLGLFVKKRESSRRRVVTVVPPVV